MTEKIEGGARGDCGKSCFARGCRNPEKHVGPGSKFCIPCSDLVSAGREAKDLCPRCKRLYIEWLTRPVAPTWMRDFATRARAASEPKAPQEGPDKKEE